MKTIKIQRNGWQPTFANADPGSVFWLFVHGTRYPPELRDNPPRVRIVKHHATHTECELLDDWPDAPEYWPPESAPPPPKNETNKTKAANQGREAQAT